MYTRSSQTKYYTKEDNLKFYGNCRNYLKQTARLLLDSSLISQTNIKKYTHKIIKVGDYYQIYDFNKVNLKKDKDYEKIKYVCKIKSIKDNSKDDKVSLEYRKFANNPLYKEKSRAVPIEEFKHIDLPIKINNKKKEIELKNINRSKFELQRIVKANENRFKTFITLTFEENLQDISEANKIFNSFRTYIKRLKKDLIYICVPEFQKRGAIHYHLLTNIEYNDLNLLSEKEVKLWSKKSNSWQIGKNIIGWNKGFTLVKDMKDINVVGYLSKYMTKDIDNRLWGKRRYLCSQNIIKPKISYLNVTNLDDFSKLVNLTSDLKLIYSSSYNNFYNEKVNFLEYKKCDIIDI